MYKRLALTFQTSSNSRTFYKLACSDNYLCDFFDNWSFKLSGKLSFNTVKAYSEAAALFINYMFEAEKMLGGLSARQLFEILESYESFLAFGQNSDTVLAANLAKKLEQKPLGAASIDLNFTGVNNFLEQSENLRVTLLSLTSRGVETLIVPTDMPFASFGKIKAPEHVQKAIKESSWLNGCLYGGMRKIKRQHLKSKSSLSTIIHTDEFGGDEKTFPIDKCVELINSAKNIRDKLLWSYIAATGCRISEAQTSLKEDVVINISDNGKDTVVSKNIFIIDPDTRRELLSKYLSEEQINSLPHKGRSHPETFMIEPFASIFWNAYDEYTAFFRAKRKKDGLGIDNDFIFKTLDKGKPCINSYQTLYDSFSEASKKVTGNQYGFHSLRHMYGYYLKNFCPMPDGSFGMNLKSVSKYMGHKEMSSTERYARDDILKLTSAMSAMNIERNRMPHFSIKNAKIEFLQAEIDRLRAMGTETNGMELVHD